MKYLVDNFQFHTDQPWEHKTLLQDKALKELTDHDKPCFVPVIKKQEVANTISKLLHYHGADTSYEPEGILSGNASPTLTKNDTCIIAIEAEAGEPCSDGLLWYKVKV